MKKIKELFATPQRAITASVCLVAAIAIIGTGSSFAAEVIAKNNSIGKTAAENEAIEDAGVSSAQVIFDRTEFDRENGQYVYEVEFTANGIEYDYLVKASDGIVISRHSDVIDGSNNVNSQLSQNNTTPNPDTENADETAIANVTSNTSINVEKAKSIAIQHAGLSTSDVTFTKAKLTNDDGRQEYEVEFYSGSTEYDYSIDPFSGSIIEYDFDSDEYDRYDD